MSPLDPFPYLHTRPSSGWVNDPNGIGRWDDRWHVMYQWNPNAPEHDHIHWGHMSSSDLLSWRDEGVALRPRPGQIDAAGVWSGVAVTDSDGVALVYTAVAEDARTAGVAVARRAPDGRWIQPDRTASEHPDHERWVDVRDPFVVNVRGRRLGIMGAGLSGPGGEREPVGALTTARSGAVLVYDVDDLDTWRVLGTLVTAADLPVHMVGAGAIWECPQLVPVGDRWLLVVSWDEGAPPPDRGDDAPRARRHGVAGYVGELDTSGPVPRFVATTEQALDHGPDFYAPQLIADGDRLLAWGWSWEGRGTDTNHRSGAEIAASGWAGTLTFPREVVIDPAGHAVLVPASELIRLAGDPIEVRDVDGQHEMRTSAPAWRLDTAGAVTVEFLDEATGSARTVWTGSGQGSVSVLVDGSIVEVFDRTGSTTLRAYATAGEVWRARSTRAASAAILRLLRG